MVKAIDQTVEEEYALYNGDCIELIEVLPDGVVGLSVFSPPFPGMYAYTDSEKDMGNVKNQEEMIEHYKFLIPGLLRVTMPGRSCCVHLCQGVAFKGADGYIGIKDFRGAIIAAMEGLGWIYYGEVCIEKNPQVKAIRTKDAGLAFRSLAMDSARMHMALADYILQFRKPGDNPAPIRAGISAKYDNPDGWIANEEWIEWASPIWHMQSEAYPNGICETRVLNNYRSGRVAEDEKHLCPLQLDVIERCVNLWSAPGELVLSPFAGIGSEGYVALKLGRRFVGFELKSSYYRVAVDNLERAIQERNDERRDLFSMAEEQEALTC